MHSASLVCTCVQALVSVFVLRVKLDVTMPGRCHFNEKWLEKDGYKSWLLKDKNPNKAFCKKSIDQNIGLNANILQV